MIARGVRRGLPAQCKCKCARVSTASIVALANKPIQAALANRMRDHTFSISPNMEGSRLPLICANADAKLRAEDVKSTRRVGV